MAGGALGAWIGGWFSGRIDRWTGELCWGRRAIGVSCLSLAAVSLWGILISDDPKVLSVCAAIASGVSQIQIATWWSVVMSISGRHLGALFGLMNSMGVVGGYTSSVFFGWFADHRKAQGFTGREQWDPGFLLYVGVLAFGALCWLVVDPRRSAVGEEQTLTDPATPSTDA
jgi:MFS family permease